MKNMSPESTINHAVLLSAVSRGAGTVNGTGVDFKGCGDILVLLKAGTSVASSTHDVALEDSADNSTFAPIVGAAFAQVTPSNDEASYLGILRKGSYRRYVRAVSVVAAAASVAGVDAFAMAPQHSDLADGGAAYAFKV